MFKINFISSTTTILCISTYRKTSHCFAAQTSVFPYARPYSSGSSAGEWMSNWFNNVRTPVPVFKVKGENIKILSNPQQFYDELIKRSSSARKGITLASLYLGNGEMEEKLVDTIHKNMVSNDDVTLNVLLEHTRGSRGQKNSRTMLLPTLNEFTSRTSVSLFHTPNLRGFLRQIIPERFNETLNVMHIKVYLFDDTLIMSGANLSNDYFTNRQDRYIMFKDCAEICNYFHDLVKTVSKFSFQLTPDDQVNLHPDFNIHPYKNSKKLFNSEANKILTAFTEKYAKSRFQVTDVTNLSNKNNNTDTLVLPLLQMKTFGIEQDEHVTTNLLSTAPLNSNICLATAYFNVTDGYWNAILNSKAMYDVIMAHPKAMGFYKAPGLAGGIPNAYNLISRKRFNDIEKKDETKRITFKEYLRPMWTFHGKGLWAQFNDKAEPVLTLIGSPNFGKRSAYRDLEAQVAIVTSNETLKQNMLDERDSMVLQSTKITKETYTDKERAPSWWVYLISTIMNDQF